MNSFHYPRFVQRNPYLELLLREGTNTTPIASPAQGLSRLAFALLAGLEARPHQGGRPQASLDWPAAMPPSGLPHAAATGGADSVDRPGAVPYLMEQSRLPWGQRG